MNNEEQKNDSSESASGFFALNKRDQNVVSVLLLLIIILSSIYFIFFKQISYGPRGELNNIQSTNTNIGLIDLNQKFTEEDVKNSELREFPYIDDLKIQRVANYNDRNFNRIQFVDGSAKFEYCSSNENCYYYGSSTPTSSKTAYIKLENITFHPPGMSLNGEDFYGDLDGISVIKTEVEGKIYRFLTTFGIYREGPGVNKNYIYFNHIIELKKDVKKINIEDGPIFKIEYKDGSTDLYTYSLSFNGGSTFVRLTEDKKFKKFEYKDDISLLYPSDSSAYATYYSVSRAWAAEQYNAVKPIFYSEACEVENNFSDFDMYIRKRTIDGSTGSGYKIHYYMNFGITNPDFDTMYLTSASWGYNADDWNKILSTLKYKNYLDLIKQGKTLSGAPSTQVDIAGKKIMYIAEKPLPRPCDERSADQYIWAEGDRVFTLTVKNVDTPKSEMDKIISDFISSINVAR